MTALADPPQWWNAETVTPPSANLAAAGFGVVPKLVLADAARLDALNSFKDCRSAPDFQGHFRVGCLRSQWESDMPDDLRREMTSVLLDAERLMKRWSTGLEKSNPFVGRYSTGQLNRIWDLLGERIEEILEELWYEYDYGTKQQDFELHKFEMMLRLMREGARPGDDAFVPEVGARVIVAPERSESRIERAMLAALRHYGRLCADPSKIAEDCRQAPAQRGIFIYQQAPVLGYRADFLLGALAAVDAAPHWVIVECDGHQFHERTADQAEHDRARDRAMTAAGYRVFRFTGREIQRDARRCADEVLKYLQPFAGGGHA